MRLTKIWNALFTPADLARVRVIAVKHGQRADSEAVRFAMREQVIRDLQRGVVVDALEPVYLAGYETVKAKPWTRANRRPESQVEALEANSGRSKMQLFRFHCRGEDFAAMKSIMENHNFKSLAEAIRFAVYVQSELDKETGT